MSGAGTQINPRCIGLVAKATEDKLTYMCTCGQYISSRKMRNKKVMLIQEHVY